ncbi:Chemotaxis protein CheA [Planctomycetes bacterium Pan216]|uniref:Chemotaxis protein CheA n=1 Tax=Kolteria novifilia TaxID=2527975 RepID=A0A518B2D3_9BACT|nr:Chemotaxis protein CheA [Planctomycetes bacterium Pan216]
MSPRLGNDDQPMLELFRAELETHTEVLSEGLLRLEKEPSRGDQIESMMRAAHSIKGAARIVGIEEAVRVAHVMEDMFVAVGRGDFVLNGNAVDALLGGLDMLTRIGEEVGEETSEEISLDAENAAAAIQALREGGGEPAEPEPMPEVSTPSEPAPAEDRSCSLSPGGDLDEAAAADLRHALLEYLGEGNTHYRLDLANVREIHPTALSVLVQFARKAGQQRDIELQVVGARDAVADLFRSFGLDRQFRLPSQGGRA